MAYQLKSTGIATSCTMCIAVDPDTDEIKDFASASVTADMIVDAGIVIGSQTWDGITRKYFQINSSNSVKFGTTKPEWVFNVAALQRTAIWIGQAASYPVRVIGKNSSHYFAGRDLVVTGQKMPFVNGMGWATSGDGGLQPPQIDEKLIFGFSATHGGTATGYRASHDDVSMTSGSMASPTATTVAGNFDIERVGSHTGSNASQDDKIHAVLIFDTALSESDFDDLRDDWFGTLFESAGGASVSFSGTVPTLNGTESAAFSEDLSGYFSGTETPFTYSVQSGTLPDGLSLNTSTGVISGTPTTAGTASGIVIRATDSAANTADTNSFDITIAAAATAISFSGTVPTQNLTENTAMTSLDLSAYFSGSETPFSYAVQTGSLPAGLSLNTSTGVISGTPTATGTFSIVVRATDNSANTADTNSFDIVVASASGTVTATDPLKNNTGTVLPNETGVLVVVLAAADLTEVHRETGQTTDASGLLSDPLTDAAITASSDYRLEYKLASGAVGISKIYTAT